MSARIRNISIDCHDTYALAGFWAQVFGTGRQPDGFPGDPEAMVRTADGETVLLLQVPEGKRGELETVPWQTDLGGWPPLGSVEGLYGPHPRHCCGLRAPSDGGPLP
ncbi:MULTISPECIES: VOC family protein [unclassified Micromonospora]|uniref:VOC family protein n=1 Tax=unclassified Micromonospora TaxID=2617518 RepID=UPI00363FF6D8